MLDPNAILRRLVADIRVELTDEFDRNFQRKAFFTEKWKKRRDKNAKGTLLVVDNPGVRLAVVLAAERLRHGKG